MKIAIYNKEGTFATVFDGITSPKIIDEELTFDNGSLSGFDENHILLDDETDIPATLEEAKLLDKRAQYTFENANETEELKKQLAETNALILDFMESILV